MHSRSPGILLRRPLVVVLFVLAVVGLAVRAALPTLITKHLNSVVNEVRGIAGGVQDVDLHLWRGAFSIHGLELYQLGARGRYPMLSAPRTELSIDWKALWHGAVVGEIVVYDPRISIIAGAEKMQARATDELVKKLREPLPVRINRLELINAQVHFRDPKAKPEVDVYLDQVHLVARNLTNSEQISDTLVATVSAEGRVMRSGKFNLEMKFDPFVKRPTYELACELKDLRLPELNTFLRHYLAVEVRDGWLSMSAESKASKGRFTGYVKPATRDLDIVRIKAEEKAPLEAVKGFFVKLLADLFENKPKDQLASKIEFSGSFQDPDVNLWTAVSSFFRNAFVRALDPELEGSVAPAQVQAERSRAKDRVR